MIILNKIPLHHPQMLALTGVCRDQRNNAGFSDSPTPAERRFTRSEIGLTRKKFHFSIRILFVLGVSCAKYAINKTQTRITPLKFGQSSKKICTLMD